METILIEVENSERSKEIKSALKALYVKFTTAEGAEESKKIAKSVTKGYKEMLDIKSGKLKAKDARDLID
ncbi:hypothetical protein LV84_00989 [Algoriphagus ratkowskyi]|uniref:Uncharacterized protein n=1 Tax=Algoriphagus ratkowskyi TaxID=57028 RepID=A0A2W7RMR0_9BACT|nr:hypothetical protein [Algoriphagus ratkowskyi]PZX59780.1 hypothetical protein LV84_00989 [Algoriphagus ratkowskyi]TXD78509.1 hypothetical protein ESW18_06870 [Algoriphagus ratkowskyi]